MPSKPNNNRPDRGANRKAGNAPKLTAEQKRHLLAKQLGLKPKSKQVLDLLIDNPKLSQVDAYAAVHKTTNRTSAVNSASRLLAKDSARIYTDRAVGKAKRRIVSLVSSKNEAIALKASDSILDRTLGKSIQRSESTQQTVHVNLDTQGLRIGAHHIIAPPVPVIPE